MTSSTLQTRPDWLLYEGMSVGVDGVGPMFCLPMIPESACGELMSSLEFGSSEWEVGRPGAEQPFRGGSLLDLDGVSAKEKTMTSLFFEEEFTLNRFYMQTWSYHICNIRYEGVSLHARQHQTAYSRNHQFPRDRGNYRSLTGQLKIQI